MTQPFNATAAEPGPYTFDLNLNQERQDDIIARLDVWNKTHTPNHEANRDERFTEEPIQLFALDSEGKLIGGLIGQTHSLREWLAISILFVDESSRGRGLGRELMKRAEDEAYHRGCRYARVATGRHQAAGFYERLGYTLYAELENFPPGVTFCWYSKRLAEPESGEG